MIFLGYIKRICFISICIFTLNIIQTTPPSHYIMSSLSSSSSSPLSSVLLTNNPYILTHIAEYLRDKDHINFCIEFGINFDPRCITIDGFIYNEKSIYEYQMNETNKRIAWMLRYFKYWYDEKPKHNSIVVSRFNKLLLTNTFIPWIETADEMLQYAKYINWEFVDYNLLPESFYSEIWNYMEKYSFYSECNKHKWLYDNVDIFDKKNTTALYVNKIFMSSVELIDRYIHYIDWSKLYYSMCPLPILRHFEDRIDWTRFTETITDAHIIFEYIDCFDWEWHNLMWHITNDDAGDISNFERATEHFICFHNTNYEILLNIWENMNYKLQRYYTRFPQMLVDHLEQENMRIRICENCLSSYRLHK